MTGYIVLIMFILFLAGVDISEEVIQGLPKV